MKFIYRLSIIIGCTFLLTNCSDDSRESLNDTNLKGLLKSIQGYVNGDPIAETTTLTYDEDRRLTKIVYTQGGFQTITSDIQYNDSLVSNLSITEQFTNTGNMITTDYDVLYHNNQITLNDAIGVEIYSIMTSHAYVDTFRQYFGSDHQYYNEAVFVRDANKNIDTISHYVTNETDSNLLVWQYTYDDFDQETYVNHHVNPVYYYSFSNYNAFIGLALDLTLSKEVPLMASYLDGNGIYIPAYLEVEIIRSENHMITQLGYSIADLPSNNYSLAFEYY